MKITGEATLVAPIDKVWEALLDPRVLVATIPGCERLEQTGENAYAMTVTAGVAAIRGTYSGTCELADLVEHESLTMHLQGAGAPGTIGAVVPVRFEDNQNSTTTLFYDAEAVVGGMVGGVGQRMLTSVSRRMAAEFFTNVERAIAEGVPDAVAPSGVEPQPGEGAVYSSVPPRSSYSGPGFLTGVLVGGALVLGGAIVGGLLGRRTRG